MLRPYLPRIYQHKVTTPKKNVILSYCLVSRHAVICSNFWVWVKMVEIGTKPVFCDWSKDYRLAAILFQHNSIKVSYAEHEDFGKTIYKRRKTRKQLASICKKIQVSKYEELFTKLLHRNWSILQSWKRVCSKQIMNVFHQS